MSPHYTHWTFNSLSAQDGLALAIFIRLWEYGIPGSDLLRPLLRLSRTLLHQEVPPVELHHRSVLHVAQNLGHRLIRVTLQGNKGGVLRIKSI